MTGTNAAIDAGSTAWMLVSSALVLLMVPGLALFYGGLVRRKNVLTTMLQSFAAMGIIGVQWIVIGYALAFGTSHGGVIGWDRSLVGLLGLPYTRNFADKAIPELVFVMFQGKFAIITPALISGAVAERMKFSPTCGSCCSGPRSSTARSPTGCGPRAAGCSSTASSTSPAAPSSTSRRASRRSCSR
jgi:Amt family ammonium transporter